MSSLLAGESVPKTLFWPRHGRPPKLVEFKSGKYRLLAYRLTLIDGANGYVLLHGCTKAGGQNNDIRSEDEQAAKQRIKTAIEILKQNKSIK